MFCSQGVAKVRGAAAACPSPRTLPKQPKRGAGVPKPAVAAVAAKTAPTPVAAAAAAARRRDAPRARRKTLPPTPGQARAARISVPVR